MAYPKSSSKKPTSPNQQKAEHRRADDFVSKYSNNIQLETSSWDLKLNFGELDQSLGPQVVVQHTAITLPWNYVKVLSYLLQLNLLGYETAHGRVIIPKGIIAPIPAEKPAELDVSDENFAAVRKFYADFISLNPEAAPDQQS